jgi:hypothetical protein
VAVPVVETTEAPKPTPLIKPWTQLAKASAPEAVAPEAVAPEAVAPEAVAPEAVAPAPTTDATPDFSQLKFTSLKADLLEYTAFYGLPVDETDTKVEIWAAIEAHKASLAT